MLSKSILWIIRTKDIHRMLWYVSIGCFRAKASDGYVPKFKTRPVVLVTDTSYFPTDDLGDVPNEPVGADTDSGSKDLAFLGYTFRRHENSSGGEF
ncbi:hypothetical protein PSTG_12025 [Puccinia striiformis f. sp. tritici PST-78]|uniref:AGC-kinase C-terminal domain-containing protein n=1 Tax=Puccinia striiformis f. sp. tritici PST-78 TaxID=1165861 RepID=A0A0L0V5X2_9BASI|nr:hypothetical protein PSTG_12025 [Puccinia striiformis f. sp. tritici PST-78]